MKDKSICPDCGEKMYVAKTIEKIEIHKMNADGTLCKNVEEVHEHAPSAYEYIAFCPNCKRQIYNYSPY